jgi:hypothetical protein
MQAKKSPITFGSPLCTEIIGCLRECFEDLDSGDPTRIARWTADPYFQREPDITQEDADRLIEALDKRLDREIDGYPAYHKRRSGANAYTEFHRLPPSARLGLAQRLARIADSFD